MPMSLVPSSTPRTSGGFDCRGGHGALGLSEGIRRRYHRQLRYPGHPDSDVDCDGGVHGGHRNFGGQAVYGRGDSGPAAGPDADGRDLNRRAHQEAAGPAKGDLPRVADLRPPGVLGLAVVGDHPGGIYSGMFTPTEAAAVYSAFVALFVYKDMKIKDCPKVLLESGRLAIMLMFIIANAMLFAHVLTTEQIPQEITAWVISEGLTPIGFLIMVNVVLLVAGSFMEPSAIVLILAPIFFPIAMKLGIDPIHLGIVMVVNMEIGLVHPPVGLNLFVTSAVTGLTLGQTIRAALPWLMILLVFLIMVTYLPFISLALPHWLGM